MFLPATVKIKYRFLWVITSVGPCAFSAFSSSFSCEWRPEWGWKFNVFSGNHSFLLQNHSGFRDVYIISKWSMSKDIKPGKPKRYGVILTVPMFFLFPRLTLDCSGKLLWLRSHRREFRALPASGRSWVGKVSLTWKVIKKSCWSCGNPW